MENLKRNFGELISVLTATFFLSAVVYILAYSNTLGVEISKYFKLSDYVDVAIGSLAPTVVILFIGVIGGYVDESIRKNFNVKIQYLLFALLSITFLLNFSSITIPISKIFIVYFTLLVLLGLLRFFIKYKEILKLKPPSSENALVIVIVFLLISYAVGSVHASQIIKNGIKENPQTIILSDKNHVTGNVLFVLSDYIIIMGNEENSFNVLFRDDITQIIEFVK